MDQSAAYKVVGIILALVSGFFIGISFVVKKKGLLSANLKYGSEVQLFLTKIGLIFLTYEAGDGHKYLQSWLWWSGMSLMTLGEVLNFVAYAFAEAIVVTPLGALSVVVSAVGSSVFLKERLSFVGKVACAMCMLGAAIIVLNSPTCKKATTIQDFLHFVIAPGFLIYSGLCMSISLLLALWVAPRYGKKTMFVYISICSLIGGLSVVSTQGLGSSIVSSISTKSTDQIKQWFFWVLLLFVVSTLLIEINYLNKALNIYNTALVTPTYYVYFTSSTIIASSILFQGFNGSPLQIISVVMGFLVVCGGVLLLQFSKSAVTLKDTAILGSNLDDIKAIAQAQSEIEEPEADAIRGTSSLRRLSTMRISSRQLRQRKPSLEKTSIPVSRNSRLFSALRPRSQISIPDNISIPITSVRYDPSKLKTYFSPSLPPKVADYNGNSSMQELGICKSGESLSKEPGKSWRQNPDSAQKDCISALPRAFFAQSDNEQNIRKVESNDRQHTHMSRLSEVNEETLKERNKAKRV